MAVRWLVFLSVVIVALGACKRGDDRKTKEQLDMELEARARELVKKVILVDGHIDVPWRLSKQKAKEGRITADVTKEAPDGDFDYPRAKAGGLDAPFMSIYIPSEYQEKGGARALADELIDIVEDIARRAPDKFALARSPEDIEKNFAAGKISLPMGIENGAALEGKLENVAHFHGRGVRYITLTHSRDNDICDSSYDDRRTHGGLSDFGRQVVKEMNRVGIMIDVSHVSDETFYQVLELSEAPVIASHSSCRVFTPDWERNMSDDMIRKLGEKGGVIMINFGSSFVNERVRAYREKRREAARAFARDNGLSDDDPRMESFLAEYDRKQRQVFLYATVAEVADHIDHVVKLAGIDHVGLGSDFDGVGDSLPEGLKDVSGYPNLVKELLHRGYTEEDVARIAYKNVFRVWKQVQARAASRS